MDFAGVAGIMAAEQEVMILGGIVMAFFLILLLIIRTAKRNDVPRASHMSGDTDPTMHGQGKPRITELTNIEGPVKEPMLDSAPDNEAEKLAQQLSIDGMPPELGNFPTGCAFHTRCKFAKASCKETLPEVLNLTSNHRIFCPVNPFSELSNSGSN